MDRSDRRRSPRTGFFANVYDPIIEPVEWLGLGGLRRETLRDISGDVLEIGFGTGRSLAAYPDAVSSITGIDPDEKMLLRAENRARNLAVSKVSEKSVRLLALPAEELPFPNGSFDSITAFLTLCTVRDQGSALREARRVLKPGGELALLEHVRLEREPLGRLQQMLTPAWKRIAGGCHLDRQTLHGVREAGFEVERVERYLGGLVLRIHARKPA